MQQRRTMRAGDQPLVKWTLIGLAIITTLLMLVIPLVLIFDMAFSAGAGNYWDNLTNQYTRHAIGLTLLVAALTVPINLVFGVFLAWLVTRFEFPGRKALITLIDIPFAVSPVVAGLLYLLLYGSNGWIGSWLMDNEVQLMFAWPGIVMVTVFVTCSLRGAGAYPAMQQQGREEEEAGVVLGHRLAAVPAYHPANIQWALLYGVVLTNARAVGEFGAVSVVSGNIRGETNTLSLHIELLYQDYNVVGSFAAASLLAGIALITIVVKSFVEWRQARQRAPLAELSDGR